MADGDPTDAASGVTVEFATVDERDDPGDRDRQDPPAERRARSERPARAERPNRANPQADPHTPPDRAHPPNRGNHRDAHLPADPRDDLRNQLPGLEPDRRVTDWGRSERVEGLVDRTAYRFLYHYWFRVAVEGIENVPREGGALLVANHGGLIPSDAAMIAKAVRNEHPLRRPVSLVSDRAFRSVPGLGMVATKIGAVPAHPSNLLRLLFDERELALAFPEGRRGPAKPLKDRYRVRRFDARYVEGALRARVPIVPVAVVGSEEALPVLARLGARGPLAALTRVVRLPSIPLAPAVPLPAKFQIRFLEPVATDDLGADPWEDQGLVFALGHEIRALIQENLLEMVGERRSVWLG